jgi:hypothetical protein
VVATAVLTSLADLVVAMGLTRLAKVNVLLTPVMPDTFPLVTCMLLVLKLVACAVVAVKSVSPVTVPPVACIFDVLKFVLCPVVAVKSIRPVMVPPVACMLLVLKFVLCPKAVEKLVNPVMSFAKPGIYDVKLTVKDAVGNESYETIKIKVGNAVPVVDIKIKSNKSFVLDRKTKSIPLYDCNLNFKFSATFS